MRRFFIGISLGLACVLSAGQGLAAVGTSDPHALEVARELAGARFAAWSKVEPAIELMVSRQVIQTLDVREAAKSEKVTAVVRDSLEAVGGEMIEVRAKALAGTYSSSELDGLLAFRRSDIGQAFSQASPELAREVAAALKSGAPPAQEPPAPPEKRELVRRILASEGAEGLARRGWRTLHAAGGQAMLAAGRTPATPAPADDRAAEDDYAHLMLAVEEGFLAKTFSTAQLSQLAAYYESPIGRAAVERGPQLARAAGVEIQALFARRFAEIEQRACEAVACQPSQRKALELSFDQFRSMLAMAAGAYAQ
jgi:hypothetical protein